MRPYATKSKRIVFQCCFCPKGIAIRGHDPLGISLLSAKDVEQTFWCHVKCFASKIDKTMLREELGGPKIDWENMRPVSKKRREEIMGKLGLTRRPGARP